MYLEQRMLRMIQRAKDRGRPDSAKISEDSLQSLLNQKSVEEIYRTGPMLNTDREIEDHDD